MKKRTTKKGITKTAVQKKVGRKIEIKKITQNGSEYWADFKVKNELGTYNTSGRTLEELCENIKRMSKY